MCRNTWLKNFKVHKRLHFLFYHSGTRCKFGLHETVQFEDTECKPRRVRRVFSKVQKCVLLGTQKR